MTREEEAAHAYAALGVRIFPLVWYGYADDVDAPNADSKIPGTPLVKWRDEATTDSTQISKWWARWPKAGIGLPTGQELAPGRFLVVLDVDEHDPAASGREALAELEEANGKLPEGPLVLTAGGGLHHYFVSEVAHTNARGSLPAGIDVRGEGGYVVVPPSSHKSGGRHEWDGDLELGVVRIPEAPSWLDEILQDVPEVPQPVEKPPQKPRDSFYDDLGGERPGDRFSEETTWAELLLPDGWTHVRTTSEGHEEWVRPGKDPRNGISATTGYGGSASLVVHSTNANVPEGNYSKLGYFTATRHAGNFSEAARELAARYEPPRPPRDVDPITGEILRPHDVDEDGELDEEDDWKPVDVVDLGRRIARGEFEPELPALLRVTNGEPLLYPGRTHVIFGPPGGGKTWTALAAAAETLIDGGEVLFVDYEDSAQGVVSRLLRLGVPVDALARFDYRTVATSLRYGWRTIDGNGKPYSLVVIDSTGEALAAQGVNPNDDGEVAAYMTLVREFTRREEGPAVLLLDHVPKSTDNPHGAPIGSQRKLAAVSGAAYRCDTITEPAKGKAGLLKLTVTKDRLGFRAKGTTASEVHIADEGEGIRVALVKGIADLAAEEDGRFYPTVLMERISQFLTYREDLGDRGSSRRTVEKEVTGKATGLRQAIDALVDLGYVRETTLGGSVGSALYVVKPYAEGDPLSPVDNPPEPVEVARPPGPSASLSASPLRVPASQRVPSASPLVDSTASPARPYQEESASPASSPLEGEDGDALSEGDLVEKKNPRRGGLF